MVPISFAGLLVFGSNGGRFDLNLFGRLGHLHACGIAKVQDDRRCGIGASYTHRDADALQLG